VIEQDFVAVHESKIGPSLHIAPPRTVGRKRGIAEIDGPTSIAEGDARDPEPNSMLLLLAVELE
jgi:hypothetical protein